LVVALKRMSSRSVLLSPEAVRSISWRGKAAWVNLSISELELGDEFDPTMPVSGGERRPPLDYYGRPVYTPPDVRH
jgi:hypothetical protein